MNIDNVHNIETARMWFFERFGLDSIISHYDSDGTLDYLAVMVSDVEIFFIYHRHSKWTGTTDSFLDPNDPDDRWVHTHDIKWLKGFRKIA
jgi:hypothetical protein